MRTLRLLSVTILSLVLSTVYGVAGTGSFSWSTPVASPSPFVGISVQPTPVPDLPFAMLCLQDNAGPVICGKDLVIAAGDTLSVGVSNGAPSSTGMPQGPWPATVTLVVNGVAFTGLAVNPSNGLIVQRIIPGSQSLTIQLQGTSAYVGAVQSVRTQ